MKSKEEILRRAVCLLCFADRCSLESEYADGIRHTLKERETQRQLICKWLHDKGYYEFLTDDEKKS